MAIKVREIAGSEEGTEGLDDASYELVYRVFDPANPNPTIVDMRAAVLAVAPSSIGSLILDKLAREYDENGNSWVWSASYNFKPAEDTLRWGFNTQGGTVRVTHSRSTTKYPSGAPDFNGGVAFSNGELQGTDIVIPALKLTASYRWGADTFTTSEANALAAMTGSVNSATWQTYAAGELLFLGASGEIIPGKPTDISYEFVASANATGLSIGAITGIAKKGHEFLWVLWEDDEDATAKRLTKKQLGVYVDQVYPTAAFSSLGIG